MPGARELSTVEWHSAHSMPTELRLPSLSKKPLTPTTAFSLSRANVVAGSGAGAMILGDPMIDPRGGAFTIGLALIELVAVLPAASTWSSERVRRTISLAPAEVALVAVDEATAVIRERSGEWTAEGVGSVEVHIGGGRADLDALRR